MLSWKFHHLEQSENLWDSLAGANTEIFDCLEELSSHYRVSICFLFHRFLALSADLCL